MATRVSKVLGAGQNILSRKLSGGPILAATAKRTMAVYTDSGAVLGRPEQTRIGLIKVAMVVFPFLYGGAMLSKHGAAFLEENEIFIPDDDDD